MIILSTMSVVVSLVTGALALGCVAAYEKEKQEIYSVVGIGLQLVCIVAAILAGWLSK